MCRRPARCFQHQLQLLLSDTSITTCSTGKTTQTAALTAASASLASSKYVQLCEVTNAVLGAVANQQNCLHLSTGWYRTVSMLVLPTPLLPAVRLLYVLQTTVVAALLLYTTPDEPKVPRASWCKLGDVLRNL